MDLGPILTSAGLIGVGAVGTYVTGALQFRRQQKAERLRWLEDKRFEVYTEVTSSLRSSGDLATDLADHYSDHATPWRGPVTRDTGTLTVTAALNQLQLVGSPDVRHYAESLDRWYTNVRIEGSVWREDLATLVDLVQSLEVAMRQDMQDDYV